jgi:hypothetical protein
MPRRRSGPPVVLEPDEIIPRGPGESCSDVILLLLVEMEERHSSHVKPWSTTMTPPVRMVLPLGNDRAQYEFPQQAPRYQRAIETMLTYYYALISDPCERTADALLEYARAHPGCLLKLPPADSSAIYRAIATAWGDAPESEEFRLAIGRRTLN